MRTGLGGIEICIALRCLRRSGLWGTFSFSIKSERHVKWKNCDAHIIAVYLITLFKDYWIICRYRFYIRTEELRSWPLYILPQRRNIVGDVKIFRSSIETPRKSGVRPNRTFGASLVKMYHSSFFIPETYIGGNHCLWYKGLKKALCKVKKTSF